MLAREVLILRGVITQQTGFVLKDKIIMPDLYFLCDSQNQEKKDELKAVDDCKKPLSAQIDNSKPNNVNFLNIF